MSHLENRLDLVHQYPELLSADVKSHEDKALLKVQAPNNDLQEEACANSSNNESQLTLASSHHNINRILKKLILTLWNLLQHKYTHTHHNVALYLYKVRAHTNNPVSKFPFFLLL